VDRDRLLALMDRNMQEMYREMTRATSGGFVVERGGLVMVGAPLGTIVTNMAIVAAPTDVDTIRRETTRVYAAAGLPFSLHTRAHADTALEATLEASGFREINATPGMVLEPGDRQGERRASPRELAVDAVATDGDRRAYAEVMAEAYAIYGTPRDSTRAFFERLDAVTGPTTQAYLGRVDGRAVAGAMLYLSHGIAGVGWVGTRPERFGRGYGSALTWYVVDEGFRRGAPLVNLQASPMGGPVYRRMGFSTPTHYRMFIDVA
jgi:GNAT superfamily N-acetyltransferase